MFEGTLPALLKAARESDAFIGNARKAVGKIVGPLADHVCPLLVGS